MQRDNLTVEIMEDGTIKTTTSAVSAGNHQNAEQFIAAMSLLAGGDTTRRRRSRSQAHHHYHEGQGEHGHSHS